MSEYVVRHNHTMTAWSQGTYGLLQSSERVETFANCTRLMKIEIGAHDGCGEIRQLLLHLLNAFPKHNIDIDHNEIPVIKIFIHQNSEENNNNNKYENVLNGQKDTLIDG